MKINKFISFIILACLVACADLQDAMPGMSYSDRTLLKGIQACATYSMQKAVVDLDKQAIGEEFWLSNKREFQDFEMILKKLKKEDELTELVALLNQTTEEVLKLEAQSFNAQISTLHVSEDPEYLMESGFRAITDYYMGNLKIQVHVGDTMLKVMQENGAQEKFTNLLKLYNDIPYQESPIEFVLHSKLSSFLLNELSDRMAFHEKELRTNPQLRNTQILKKTFADYDYM